MAQRRRCSATEGHECSSGQLKTESEHHSVCLWKKRRSAKGMQGRVQGTRAGPRLESVRESTWWQSKQNQSRRGRITEDKVDSRDVAVLAGGLKSAREAHVIRHD